MNMTKTLFIMVGIIFGVQALALLLYLTFGLEPETSRSYIYGGVIGYLVASVERGGWSW